MQSITVLFISPKTLLERQRDRLDREVKKKLTSVADVEAFSRVGMVRLKLQPHDVTVGGDL